MDSGLSPAELATYAESRQPALWGTLIPLLVLNNVFIVARCGVNYRVHWKVKRRLFAEDVFVILSGICVDIVIGNLLAATHYGLGLHTWRVNAEDEHRPQNLSNAFKLVPGADTVDQHIWATMVLTGPTFTFIKLTLLFFYRRLFLFKQAALKAIWWINLVYIILWLIGSTGFYVFQCWPPDWYYLQYYTKLKMPAPGGVIGQCEATSVLHVALPLIFGLVSDVALLLLPIAAIWKLKLPTRRKVALVGIFCVGFIACALELGRILELLLDTDDKTDASYGVAVFLILSAAEEVTAIACASLPIIGPPLWRNFHGQGSSSSTSDLYRHHHRPRTTTDGQKRAFYRLERSGGTEADTLAWPDRPGDAYGTGDGKVGNEAIPMTNVVHGSSCSEDSVRLGQIVVRTDIAVEVEDRDEASEAKARNKRSMASGGTRMMDV